MKLQRLMYFIYRDWYKNKRQTLIYESFVAWKCGSVLVSMYDMFKGFKNKPINKFAKNAKGEVYIIDESKNNDLHTIIDNIWTTYSKYDGKYLSFINCQLGGAWQKAINKGIGTPLDLYDILQDNT